MSLEEEARDKMASLLTAVSAIMLNVSGLYPLIKKQRFFPLEKENTAQQYAASKRQTPSIKTQVDEKRTKRGPCW